ncbi:MAG: hypothetical protein KJ697_02420 [Nanoarchaeota archaeon]|nr:hypothetical protein [Nanoarchaeota archaeon]MBU4124482.1 hypothetical protein [Nanoarchaeota archaeon]
MPSQEEIIDNSEGSIRSESEIEFIKEGKIINKKYQELFNISRQTASRELSNLAQKGMFRQVGVTGKGTFYTLVQTPQRGHDKCIKNNHWSNMIRKNRKNQVKN